MTTRVPRRRPHPRWHPEGADAARQELTARVLGVIADTRPGQRTDDLRDALDALFSGWTVTYETLTDNEVPRDGNPEPEALLRLHASPPARRLSEAETAARDAHRHRQARQIAFEAWVSVNADSPEPLSAPDFTRAEVSTLSLITNQRSWWFPSSGVWTRVEDMEPSHRRALLSLLRKQARTLQSRHDMLMAFAASDYTHGDSDAEVTSETPAEWIERMPLVHRLAELVAADAEGEAASRHRRMNPTDPPPVRRSALRGLRLPGSDAYVLPEAGPMARHKARMGDLRERLGDRETVD